MILGYQPDGFASATFPLSSESTPMNTHPALTLFTDLLSVPAPSGFEQQIATIVRTQLDAWGYAHETDSAGNIMVRLPGRQSQAPLLCLAAHLDEIGLVVTKIEPDGTLRVTRSGGLYPWKQGEGPVEILGDTGSITGILSMGSTHTAPSGQTIDWPQVRVLTGLTPDQLAAAGIRPGSAGVVALLRLLAQLKTEQIQPIRPTLVAFTVGEEVGGLGAKVLAAREQPETFIAVDGCPMPPGSPLLLDSRPGIWVKDRLAPYDQQLVRDLSLAAQSAGTALQPVVYDNAASDASLVYAIGAAQRIACFGHVRENSHGYEVARLAVFDNVLKTLVAFVTTWG
jgi:putative aminopeptidase FrvX